MLSDLISSYPAEAYCVSAGIVIGVFSWLFSRFERHWECPKIDAMDEEIERYQALGGKRPAELPKPDDDTLPAGARARKRVAA